MGITVCGLLVLGDDFRAAVKTFFNEAGKEQNGLSRRAESLNHAKKERESGR